MTAAGGTPSRDARASDAWVEDMRRFWHCVLLRLEAGLGDVGASTTQPAEAGRLFDAGVKHGPQELDRAR